MVCYGDSSLSSYADGEHLLRLCAVHARCQLNRPAENAAWLAAQLPRLAALAPDLIVTPELMLTGYAMDEAAFNWDPAACAGAMAVLDRAVCKAGLRLLLGAPYFGPQAQIPTNAIFLLGDGAPRLVREKQQSVMPDGHVSASAYAYGLAQESVSAGGQPLELLMCCESLDGQIVRQVSSRPAQAILHLSAWGASATEPYFPEAVASSLITDKLVVVINQTGEHFGDWQHAESFVYHSGQVHLARKSAQAAALWFDLDDAGRYVRGGICPLIAKAIHLDNSL